MANVQISDRKTRAFQVAGCFFAAVAAGCLCLFSISGCSSVPAADDTVPPESVLPYADAFPSAWKRGEKRAVKLEALLRDAGVPSKKARFAVAVVFPELTRYTALRGAGEVFLLKQSITRDKNDLKPYSAGLLQMRHSFAVDIETDLAARPALARLYEPIAFAGKNESEADRRARIDRITDTSVQAVYLCAFLDIFTDMYRELLPPSGSADDAVYESESWLRLCATAYNAGYRRNEEILRSFMQKTGFPYGGNDARSHWNYAEIAVRWWAGFSD